MFDQYLTPGLALIAQLQRASPALDVPMQLVTALGSLEFYLVLLPFIYWTLDPALATRTLLVLLGNDFLSSTGKILWHGPRPYWIPGDTGVRGLAAEPSYGVPSGHAGGSLVTWGYLALQVRRPLFQGLAVVLILLIGLSRPYLAVHFPHDVVVGWLIGLVAIGLAWSVQAPVQRLWAGLSRRQSQLCAGLLASLIMLWGLALPHWVADSPDPAAWQGFALNARSPAHFFALAGTLFGLLLGRRRTVELLNYAPAPSWAVRGRCFAIGMAGMALIYLGLGALTHVLAAPDTPLALGLRFMRFTLVAWWIGELAPRVFIALGWAGQERVPGGPDSACATGPIAP